MRFECNCKTEKDFEEMINGIHTTETGCNFEVGARLWVTPEGWDKSIMVEFQITTKDCKDLLENEDEPDWFTAYEVDDENDMDVSLEIFTEAVEDFKLVVLESEMLDFAKRVSKDCYVEKF